MSQKYHAELLGECFAIANDYPETNLYLTNVVERTVAVNELTLAVTSDNDSIAMSLEGADPEAEPEVAATFWFKDESTGDSQEHASVDVWGSIPPDADDLQTDHPLISSARHYFEGHPDGRVRGLADILSMFAVTPNQPNRITETDGLVHFYDFGPDEVPSQILVDNLISHLQTPTQVTYHHPKLYAAGQVGRVPFIATLSHYLEEDSFQSRHGFGVSIDTADYSLHGQLTQGEPFDEIRIVPRNTPKYSQLETNVDCMEALDKLEQATLDPELTVVSGYPAYRQLHHFLGNIWFPTMFEPEPYDRPL